MCDTGIAGDTLVQNGLFVKPSSVVVVTSTETICPRLRLALPQRAGYDIIHFYPGSNRVTVQQGAVTGGSCGFIKTRL